MSDILDALERLVNEHGSATLYKAALDESRFRISTLIDEIKDLKQENADLKDALRAYKQEAITHPPRSEMIDYRGAKFRRTDKGIDRLTIYCGVCGRPASSSDGMPFACVPSCGWVWDYSRHELEKVVKNLNET